MKKDDLHLVVACLINLIVITLLINYVWTSSSDKAIIILIIAYPAMTMFNLLIWVMMRLGKDPRYKVYRITTIGLIVLFVPIVSIATLH